jgi:hypothetical protein
MLRAVWFELDHSAKTREPSFLGDILSGDIEPGGNPRYANETNEERRARFIAMAENMRKNAELNDARGAHDIAARGREWADELERDAREIAHEPWNWSPGEMARRLSAALGRAATGEEISAAMSLAESRRMPPNPAHWEAALKSITTMLGHLAQSQSEPDQEPGRHARPRFEARRPPAPAETDEERQARLRALADDLRKNAERNDARGAHDLGTEPREWDTRSVPRRSLSNQEPQRQGEPWDWSAREMAERLIAALGRPLRGWELQDAMHLAATRRLPTDPTHWEAALKVVAQGPAAQPRSAPDQQPESPVRRPRYRQR